MRLVRPHVGRPHLEAVGVVRQAHRLQRLLPRGKGVQVEAHVQRARHAAAAAAVAPLLSLLLLLLLLLCRALGRRAHLERGEGGGVRGHGVRPQLELRPPNLRHISLADRRPASSRRGPQQPKGEGATTAAEARSSQGGGLGGVGRGGSCGLGQAPPQPLPPLPDERGV